MVVVGRPARISVRTRNWPDWPSVGSPGRATRRRLARAIEGPAGVAGLRLEPGLVDLVVRDADGQPGALPLLSHALAETWRRREAGLLTVDGYRAVGGISDAVAASAERLYDGLRPDERGQLRVADAAPGLALRQR